ncbi:MAG: L,D-transpeptidase family protein [Peptostreptococcales bacterium]
MKIVLLIVTIILFLGGCKVHKAENFVEDNQIVINIADIGIGEDAEIFEGGFIDINLVGGQIIDEYNTIVPELLQVNLKYKNYLVNYDYVVANGSVNIREAPNVQSNVIKKTAYYEKINLLETVTGEYLENYKNDKWCHVYWWDNQGEKHFGFVSSSVVRIRTFRFDEMYEELLAVEGYTQNAEITYINNYKNRSGEAPLYQGKGFDKHGVRRFQSAPGYTDLSNKDEFIYIEDGTLVKVISKTNGYYKVKVLKNNVTAFVPEKYIKNSLRLKQLTKAIVIDVKNQNEGVFEKKNDQWTLISNTLATTGANEEYKLETPPGYYFAIEKKSKFLYLDDITKKVSGYAPYAIRFTGGTYIHGVPVAYKKDGNKLIDPGHIEYSGTIGTSPLSHRCVRNYTSHAKFLYDWVDIQNTAVIVIH